MFSVSTRQRSLVERLAERLAANGCRDAEGEPGGVMRVRDGDGGGDGEYKRREQRALLCAQRRKNFRG